MANDRSLRSDARRRLAAVAMLAAGAVASATPAAAHPHVWVTVRTTVLFEKGAAIGLRQAWTFDEYYTAMAVDGLDTNHDGKYSREELAELAKVNMDGLKEFAYFVQPHLGKTEIKLAAPPPDYYLEHALAALPSVSQAAAPIVPGVAGAAKPASPSGAPSGADRIASEAEQKPAGHLTLHFTLPFAAPVHLAAQELTFTVADPSYFIAFEPAADHAITMGPGAPPSCRALAPASDDANANPFQAIGAPASGAPASGAPAAGAPAAGTQAGAAQPNGAQPTGPMATQPATPSLTFAASPEWHVACGSQK